VGRESLVHRLDRWFSSITPHNTLLLLTGKPGIGKSALLSRFLSSHDGQSKIVVAKGKFDQSATSRSGFSAVTEILSHLHSLCVSYGLHFRSQLADRLMDQLTGTERALVSICSEWGELFDTIHPLPAVTPEEEVSRIHNAIAVCLKCVCESLELSEHSLCIVFGNLSVFFCFLLILKKIDRYDAMVI
jgi:predicted ATPase